MLNKAQVIGNLGADPKVSNGQTKVASFRVATTERGYTLQNGTQVPDRTEWHNVVCFGKMAEVVEKYLKKGAKVFIEGKMRTRQYDDKNGVSRSIMEIHAESMEMLDNKQQQQGQQQPQPQQAAPSATQYNNTGNNDKDDLPF